jgi:hypothetical protein
MRAQPCAQRPVAAGAFQEPPDESETQDRLVSMLRLQIGKQEVRSKVGCTQAYIPKRIRCPAATAPRQTSQAGGSPGSLAPRRLCT